MNILHPTAFSQPAEKARILAIDLSKSLSAKLHIVHVQERFKEGNFVSTAIDDVNPNFLEYTEQNQKNEVKQLLEKLKALTPKGASYELIWGKPLRELLRIAAKYDLIVMSAHGDNPLDDYFIGGVAGRLMRRSPVPTLTLRPNSEVSSIKRVLVATDFGEASKKAWLWSQQLKAKGVELICVHIIEAPSIESGKHTFKHIKDALAAFTEGQAETAIRDGHAVEALPKLAKELAADAIVIGRKKHSAAVGLLMGSRADGLLRSSAIPILTVPL